MLAQFPVGLQLIPVKNCPGNNKLTLFIWNAAFHQLSVKVKNSSVPLVCSMEMRWVMIIWIHINNNK